MSFAKATEQDTTPLSNALEQISRIDREIDVAELTVKELKKRRESLAVVAVLVVFWHVVVWHVLVWHVLVVHVLVVHVLVVHGEGFTRAAGLPWRVGVPRIQADSSASP